MLGTSKPVPWVLLTSSGLERGIGASRSKCVNSHTGSGHEREGRSCLLGDEPLKSLSFPVSNLQNGWKLPLGKHLDVVLSALSRNRGSCLCWHEQQDRLPAWLVPACSRQHPRPHLEGQPVPPGGLLQRERRGCSGHCLPKDEGPLAPTPGGPCGAARAQFAPV